MKIKLSMLLGLVFMFLYVCPVFAKTGDYGFFGGISEGRRLPKTTELLLEDNDKDKELEAVYKEVIFLSGKPVTFEGLLTTKISDEPKKEKNPGEYDVTYEVSASASTDTENQISRDLKYNVDYRYENNQIIKDYEVDKWNETITVDGVSYKLDSSQSYSNIAVIESVTPGVTYYRGDISHKAVYTADDQKVVWELSGSFYGNNSAWSSTETQRIDGTVKTDAWQMQYQIRPSVSVGKKLQYAENEPTAISFSGNYREVMQNLSGLSYTIYTLPSSLSYSVKKEGTVSIDTFNDFEQLIAPDVSYVKGHFAESDIKKLFAMQILDGEPSFYKPNQSITRGEYVKMLVKAIKLEIEDMSKKKNRRNKEVINIVFPDVTEDREEYPYIMSAYKNGLAIGRDNGHFYTDAPIERQEAIVILLRTLGLETLGLDGMEVTPFADDANIASWAKREVYAANRLGIITGDDEGNFRPKSYVTKAEAAAFVNRLVTYMRSDLQTDYTEHIVNYAN